MKKWLFPFSLCLILFSLLLLDGTMAGEKDLATIPTSTTLDAVRTVPTTQKWVALTFDDGPYPQYTRPILDILDKYHAKATFFVVGRLAANYPDLLREMKQKGHEIANHTYTHPSMKTTSYSSINQEISHTDWVIYQATGVHTTLFRPPGGAYTAKVAQAAHDNKHRVVMYSIDTKDWSAKADTKSILYEVSGSARPGSIILLHDFGGDRTRTINALESVMQDLKGKGYSFVTVSELLSGKLKN